MLYDLHAVDERLRTHREQLVAQDFTVFYHLLSVERNSDVLLKVALSEKVSLSQVSLQFSVTLIGMSVRFGIYLVSLLPAILI
ncbi:NADH-quinone oxidoreductase subunit C [Plesiomonas shigelloides subsp. oncorhynchi]|nr:NADH-quinone oxidoreductase subunit C [Plesiomonas shigelloides]